VTQRRAADHPPRRGFSSTLHAMDAAGQKTAAHRGASTRDDAPRTPPAHAGASVDEEPIVRPSIRMEWASLLFMHWRVDARLLRPLVPEALDIDTYDGSAWIGIIPFTMPSIGPARLPRALAKRRMHESNVRTYVTAGEERGVWFFSLDASNRLMVEGARGWYNLPYFNAGRHLHRHADTVYYAMHRTDRRANPALFAGRYWPTSPVFQSQPGTLESWLTERYYLYAMGRGGDVYQGRIHHDPWPLQRAEADIQINSVAASHGIVLPPTEPLLHYSHVVQVKAWPIKRVS